MPAFIAKRSVSSSPSSRSTPLKVPIGPPDSLFRKSRMLSVAGSASQTVNGTSSNVIARQGLSSATAIALQNAALIAVDIAANGFIGKEPTRGVELVIGLINGKAQFRRKFERQTLGHDPPDL